MQSVHCETLFCKAACRNLTYCSFMTAEILDKRNNCQPYSVSCMGNISPPHQAHSSLLVGNSSEKIRPFSTRARIPRGSSRHPTEIRGSCLPRSTCPRFRCPCTRSRRNARWPDSDCELRGVTKFRQQGSSGAGGLQQRNQMSVLQKDVQTL